MGERDRERGRRGTEELFGMPAVLVAPIQVPALGHQRSRCLQEPPCLLELVGLLDGLAGKAPADTAPRDRRVHADRQRLNGSAANYCASSKPVLFPTCGQLQVSPWEPQIKRETCNLSLRVAVICSQLQGLDVPLRGRTFAGDPLSCAVASRRASWSQPPSGSTGPGSTSQRLARARLRASWASRSSLVSLRLVSLRFAAPRLISCPLVSPRLASPRLVLSCLVSIHLAPPCLAPSRLAASRPVLSSSVSPSQDLFWLPLSHPGKAWPGFGWRGMSCPCFSRLVSMVSSAS